MTGVILLPWKLLTLCYLGVAGHDGRGNAVGGLGAGVGGALLAVARTEGESSYAGGEQNNLFHEYKMRRDDAVRLQR
jgi:hypothetical protein